MASRETKRRLSAVRQAIATNRLSQTKLADRLGISKQLLTNWLQGRRSPSDAQFRQLALAVGLDPTFAGAEPSSSKRATLSRINSLAQASWQFRAAPQDGGRDYGNANVLAFTPDIETLIRELCQNALDQLAKPNGAMHVRFSLIELTSSSAPYRSFMDRMRWSDLLEHLKA